MIAGNTLGFCDIFFSYKSSVYVASGSIFGDPLICICNLKWSIDLFFFFGWR